MMDRGFEKTNRQDIESFIRKLDKTAYSDWTKRDYKVTIRKFYKWLRGTDDYPPEVKWIKSRIKNNHKLPEELLSPEDIRKLIQAATNIRDKALIAILYESGCRIGEIMGLKLKHVSFDKYGAVIHVSGKTGDRRVRLVISVPYLSNWMENHPEKHNTDYGVWVSIGTKNHHKPITYEAINKTLRIIAERAGVQKKVNPHMFRHSRATHLANKLTEAQMKEYFGWVQSSDMASIYVHLSGRDVDDAILAMHKIKEPEQESKKEALLPKKCPRCYTLNATTSKFCNKCGMALDVQTAIEMENKLNDLANLINSPDILEKLIERKVEEILETKS